MTKKTQKETKLLCLQKAKLLMATVALGVLLGVVAQQSNLIASDHDDGETDIKGRNLNLTDLYVFREDWQTGDGNDDGNMILIINLNPRSLPQQEYFFSALARYQFHWSCVNDVDDSPTGASDGILRFEFGEPNSDGGQDITASFINTEGFVVSDDAGTTTPLADSATPDITTVTLEGNDISVFAGLREDPFFFDVETFFQVRAGTLGAFLAGASAKDFAHNYNVLSIVVRAPIEIFQEVCPNDTVFDFWQTIFYPSFTAVPPVADSSN